jgi:hypothetical protein
MWLNTPAKKQLTRLGLKMTTLIQCPLLEALETKKTRSQLDKWKKSKYTDVDHVWVFKSFEGKCAGGFPMHFVMVFKGV